MSGVRKHFCAVVRSGAGGCSRPRKNGINGCIPALFRSVEWSQSGGTSEAEGCRVCPFASKNERKPSRSSAVVRTRVIVRVALSDELADEATLDVPGKPPGFPEPLPPVRWRGQALRAGRRLAVP